MCCALSRKRSTSSPAFAGSARAQIRHQRIGLARRLTEVRSRCSSIRDSLADLAGHGFVPQQHAGVPRPFCRSAAMSRTLDPAAVTVRRISLASASSRSSIPAVPRPS